MAAFTYHNDLLAPYLALPQGDKVQAECMCIQPCTQPNVLTFFSRRLDRR